MARGWESKSVESQQDDAAARRERKPALTAEERQRAAELAEIRLALARMRDQLAAARQPAHRQMLQQAIAVLEEKLQGG